MCSKYNRWFNVQYDFSVRVRAVANTFFVVVSVRGEEFVFPWYVWFVYSGAGARCTQRQARLVSCNVFVETIVGAMFGAMSLFI